MGVQGGVQRVAYGGHEPVLWVEPSKMAVVCIFSYPSKAVISTQLILLITWKSLFATAMGITTNDKSQASG